MVSWIRFAASLLLPPVPAEFPAQIVAHATAAVEGDSVATVRARWQRRLTTDSTDRAARLGLATLDRLTYDYAAAALGYGRLTGDDAWALHARMGGAHSDLWRAPFDQTVYRYLTVASGARALGDSSLAAAALSAAGFLGSRLGAMGPSLDSLDVAFQLAPRSNLALQARVLCARAPILSFAGRPGAMATAQRGLALVQQTGDRRTLGLCYHAVAMVAINDLDDSRIPLAYADSAAAAWRAARDGPMLALSHYTKGYTRFNYADFAGAKVALGEAIIEAERTGSRFVIAWSRRFLSMLYWTAGDIPASVQDFAQAESLFTMLNDGFGISHTRNGRAFAQLTLGRVAEAEATFRAQLAVSERNGMAEGVFANLQHLSAVRSVRGDWKGAREEIERAVAYGNANGHAGWTPSLDYRRGVIALRLGELDLAERVLRRFLGSLGPEQHLDRYATRTRLGEVAAQRGELDQAVAELEHAGRQLDSARSALTDTQLRLLVFQTRSALDEPDLGLAPIATILVRGDYASAAFRLAEARRARTLEAQLIRSAVLQGESTPAGAALEAIPDLPALQAGLPESLAVIAWLAGRGGAATTAYVVTRDDIQGTVLPSIDSVAHDIDLYVALLEQGEPSDAVGRRLADAMLAPAVALVPAGVNRLILIPDDRLHRIPFDALPLPDGQPLLLRYGVSRAPSAAIAVRLAARPRRTGLPTLLAFGDPRTSSADDSSHRDPEAERYRGVFAEAGGLPRLKGSAAEARDAGRFSRNAVVRLGPEASESFLKGRSLRSFRVIHLATHAVVDDQSESRTSLALAPGGGEDGFLGAGEIGELDLEADLVVLSACRTAAGRVIGGEGVQGLVAPLLGAGARAVVASLWPIGDRGTATLMQDFYDGLADGKTVGEALRDAKLAARADGTPPKIWAAFTLVGDPDIRIPLEHGRTVPWFYIGGIVLLLAVLAAWRIRVRAG